FDKSVERDPDFASPYGLAAFCYVMRKMNGWADDAKADAAEAERLALRAAQAGKDDAVALAFGGLALGYVVGDLDEAAGLIERARARSKNARLQSRGSNRLSCASGRFREIRAGAAPGRLAGVRSLSPVIAGLDPAIHHFTKNLLAKKIDHPNSGLSEFGHLNC